MKYLKLYRDWIKAGKMPDDGICVYLERIDHTLIEYGSLLDMVSPTGEDKLKLLENQHSRLYWGSDSIDLCLYEFTPLRQNLILLMACLNNEL